MRQASDAVHPSWRVDETAISVRGGYRYLYRAVDKFGKTVDSLLCADRSVWAARAFFCKAVKTHHPRPPQKVNLDGNTASHRALRLLRKENPNLQGVVIRSFGWLGIDCRLPPEVPTQICGIDYRALVEPKVFIGATTFVFLRRAVAFVKR